MKAKLICIGFSGSAEQAHPFVGILAFVDPLFTCAGLVAESHELCGGTGHVGNDGAGLRIQFAWMRFDLGDHPS